MKIFLPIGVIILMMMGCTTVHKTTNDAITQINEVIQKHPSATGGVNYYVCDDGNDDNNGLSVDTPWKSYSKAMEGYNALEAGGSILFCRGGVFNVAAGYEIYNFNCTVDKRCTIGDYSLSGGATELPVLENDASVLATFYFKDPREADHEEGVVIRNLNLHGAGVGYGVYLFNDVDDVLIQGLRIENFERGIYSGPGNTPNIGSDNINERVVADAVTFINNDDNIIGDVSLINEVSGELDGSNESSGSDTPDDIGLGTALQNQTYYVCDTGSDDNTGLTPDSPWYSFSRAANEFVNLVAGDTIAFCRGGVIDVPEYLTLINTECTAKNPCIFRDYFDPKAIGNEPLPILQSQNDLGVFYLNKRDGTPGEGIRIKNLELIGNGKGKGVFVLNGVDHIRLQDLKISNFRVGIDISTSAELSRHIYLVRSDIRDNAEQGWLGGCSHCVINGNNFENNGFAEPVMTHNIYFSGYESKNVQIVNNRLYKSGVVNGKCTSVSLVAHGTISNLTIANNLVAEDQDGSDPTCYGIGIGPGYSSEEWFKNVVIRENVVINSGNISIGCASCVDVLIEKNRITHSNTTFHSGIKIPVGPEDSLKSDRVVIQGNYIGIYGEDTRYIKAGIEVVNDGDFTIAENSVWLNNSVYLCTLIEGQEYEGLNLCEESY